jgi:hypothetical protein
MTSVEISEKSLEETIEKSLLQGGPDDPTGAKGAVHSPAGTYVELVPGGYRKRRPEEYDRGLCLIPRDVLDFVYAAQPKEWEKLKSQHGKEVKDRLLKRLASEIKQRGALDVLRRGIKDSGCRFQVAYFRPSSGLNEALEKLYQANLFSVVRQLRYSEKNEKSLDLVLFLNGIPLFTAELKNPLTGQNVEDAIQQYRFQRDPKEPLLAFRRCLGHFAVDPDLEKLYVFARLLRRYLPVEPDKLPREIQQNIDMESHRLQQSWRGKIKLERGNGQVEPVGPKGIIGAGPEEIEPLSQIIRELNERFGTDFTEEDRVFIQNLGQKLAGDLALVAAVQTNTPENARLAFDYVANDRLQDMVDANFKFYKRITDDKDFGKFFLDWLFDRFRKSLQPTERTEDTGKSDRV